MIALLRYALLKGVREKYLVLILFGQSVMIGASLLGAGTISILKGHGANEFTLYHVSAAQQATEIAWFAAAAASLTAGVAAFTLFRAEIENHSIGFFVLATRPIVIAATTALCGAVIGVGSFAVTILVTALLTASVTAQLGMIGALAIVLCLFGGALAMFLGAFSADFGMLIPFGIVSEAASVVLLNARSATMAAAALVISLILIAASSPLLERRCTG
jgi:hypothetical protein